MGVYVNVALCILAFASLGEAARLLGFFQIPSYSHQVVYHAYMQELVKKGHNVTVVTPNPLKRNIENYTEIDVSYGYKIMHANFNIAGNDGWLLRHFPEFMMIFFTSKLNELCHAYLSDPNVNRLIKDNEQFDALIIELGMMCTLPFSLQSNNITIGILSAGMTNVMHTVSGGTGNPSYSTELLIPFVPPFTLFEKIRLSVFNIFTSLLITLLGYRQHAIAETYFGPSVPDVVELQKNISLVLPHTHFSTSFARPNAQSVIDIGGPPLHMTGHVPAPLSKDLQDFLDSATDGVIYFSLGSNVKSSTMPEHKRALFLDAFRQIKQKVLWKWETDDLPNKPDNVKIHKWLPQTDVLAHPNVKAFISQGGLQSMGEATHFTVPMVVIPFFADQELNAKKLESVGVAIRLDFETMTSDDILNAIRDVATTPKYKDAMVKYSALTRDQPQTPMERAVWWTEYVLRHNGARHLRSAAVDMPWYQYFLLDVLGFLLLVVCLGLYMMHFIGSRLYRALCKNKRKSKKE